MVSASSPAPMWRFAIITSRLTIIGIFCAPPLHGIVQFVFHLNSLDVMMAKRHMGAGELAETIGITPANLSILKNNKAKAVRFSTLEALCKALDCQPADLLEYRPDET